MDTVRVCPQCGTKIAPDAPQDLCPRCLAATGRRPSTSDETVRDNRTALSESTKPPSGKSIRYFGDYELLEEIARGGMGVVYRARQVSLNRIVAVKTILSGALADSEAIQRFRREAAAAAQLQHPNIVSIHEIGEHEGQQYFSMDYVDGGTLADLIQERPLPIIETVRYLIDVAQALHHAHQRGVMHRDIKPSNVLITSEGRARVADFGLAKQIGSDAGLTHTGQIAGTPSYMAPEQAAGRLDLVGVASDIYSLGALLYAALTGKPPFEGSSTGEVLVQVLHHSARPPSHLNPEVPRELEAICLKCIEKNPGERYSSAREVADDLTRFLHHEPIHARPPSRLREITGWFSDRPWVLAGAVPVLVLAIVMFTYGLWVKNGFLDAQRKSPIALTEATLKAAPRGIGLGVLLFLCLEAFRHTYRQQVRKRILTGRLLRPAVLFRFAIVAILAFAAIVFLGTTSVRAWQWKRQFLWAWHDQPSIAEAFTPFTKARVKELQDKATPGYLFGALAPLAIAAWSLGNFGLLIAREHKFRLFFSVEEQLETRTAAQEEDNEDRKHAPNDLKILAGVVTLGGPAAIWAWLSFHGVGYDWPVAGLVFGGWLMASATLLQWFRLGWWRWLNILWGVAGALTCIYILVQVPAARSVAALVIGCICGLAQALAVRWINQRSQRV